MLIRPHGGKLVNRVLKEQSRKLYLEHQDEFFQIVIDKEKQKEVQNIAHGIFSPLEGFMTSEQLESVVNSNRLPDGNYWTIPILFPLNDEIKSKIGKDDDVILKDENGKAIAVFHIEDKFDFDKERVAKSVFGTTDSKHPGVKKLYEEPQWYIGGRLDLINEIDLPYSNYYLKPKETRYLFKRLGWSTVVAFQTRNPPHRAHEYLQKCALEMVDGLFVNPVIGQKKPGDFKDDVILKAYEVLINDFYPKGRVVLSILPWQMRYAGPKEAIFHCIVRKNFGCSHHIIGRDHAGVGNYYDPYAAHRIFDEFEGLGIKPIFFEHAFYCKACGNMATTKTCPHDKQYRMNPSGTLIRKTVNEKSEIPEEIMRKDVVKVLQSFDNPFVS